MDKSQLEMSHVDYDSSSTGSLWGTGDKVLLDVLAEILPEGVWADIGAGDGRYIRHLLKTCRKVVAFDNDPRALAKLRRELPDSLRERVECRGHDITETFFPRCRWIL